MSNDAKEWVTIKVPREVRDDARDDPRTYGDIMRNGLGGESDPGPQTEDVDLPDLSFVEATKGDIDDLKEQLDRIESAAKEATNAAQNAERAAEELQR